MLSSRKERKPDESSLPSAIASDGTSPRARLGEMLVGEGVITQGQLDEALKAQKEHGGFLGNILVSLRHLDQSTLMSFLVKQCKIPHISLLDYKVEDDLFELISKDLCKEHLCVPIDKLGKILTVAMVNPFDAEALESVRAACPEFKIKPILCDFNHFDQVARQHLNTADPDEPDKRHDVSAKSFGLSESTKPAPTKPAAPKPKPVDVESAATPTAAPVDAEAIAGAVVSAMRDVMPPSGDAPELVEAITALRESVASIASARPAENAPELIEAITALRETVSTMTVAPAVATNIESFPAASAPADGSVAEEAGALPGRDEKLAAAMSEQPSHEPYRFDNYLPGKENAASERLVRQMAGADVGLRAPLRLLGGVGLGKTHLLHAVGNAIADAYPDTRIRRLTGGMFQRQYDAASADGALNHFMTEFCQADVLLLDDVQTLAGRRDVQSAFIEVFDALASDGRLLAVSELAEVDTPKLLAAPLRSRLDSAVTATVRTPERETRLAILQKVADASDVEIQPEALDLVAERITTDVRRLIGAFQKIAAHVRASDGKVTKKQMRGLVDELVAGAVA